MLSSVQSEDWYVKDAVYMYKIKFIIFCVQKQLVCLLSELYSNAVHCVLHIVKVVFAFQSTCTETLRLAEIKHTSAWAVDGENKVTVFFDNCPGNGSYLIIDRLKLNITKVFYTLHCA